MTFTNFARGLRAFTHRQPFQPFLLQLMTGETIRIGHPEALRLNGEVAQLVEPDSRQRLFDAGSVCQLLEMPRAVTNEGANSPTPEE